MQGTVADRIVLHVARQDAVLFAVQLEIDEADEKARRSQTGASSILNSMETDTGGCLSP